MTFHEVPAVRTRRVRRRPAGSRGAYTLIELVMIIGVLGLAGALLVPKIVDQDGMEVQAAMRKTIGDLSFAQSDALAYQGYRRVHFYDDGSGFAIVRVTAADYAAEWDPDTADYLNDPLGAPGALGRYIVNFDADPRFRGTVISDVDLDGGGRDLVYDPLGGTVRAGDLPGTGGTITMSNGDHTYELRVAPFTGKLTVVSVDGGG